MLFKVLMDGRSMNGGDLQWMLPEGDKPGGWHEVEGTLELCRRGLHLTDSPAHWWKPGCSIFTVEAEGVEGDCANDSDRKVVARRVRLMRLATVEELEAVHVFTRGEHSIEGSTRVVASGSASVRASGSASVEASGSASVRASGSASVEAYGSASVEAYDSASVRAYGSASVRASGSASVRASDDVTVISWKGKDGIKLTERAVCIVRVVGKSVEVMTASES